MRPATARTLHEYGTGLRCGELPEILDRTPGEFSTMETCSMAKYGRKAQSKVARAMRERKRGTLRSGRSGKRVTSL
jgi:hypothetical protein